MSSEREHTPSAEGNYGVNRGENIVASRRGRWVIKLALALFLCRKGNMDVGEMARFHSELWSHKSLANESRARKYAAPDTDVFAAGSKWKQRLGRMWLTEGFEVCAAELESYFEQEFSQLQAQRETEEHSDETAVAPNDADRTEEARTDAVAYTTLAPPSTPLLALGGFERQLARLLQAVLTFTRRQRSMKTKMKQGWIPATDILDHLQRSNYGQLQDKEGADAGHTLPWLPTTPEQLVSLLRRFNLRRRLQFCWSGGPTAAPAATEGVAWVRAAWGHCAQLAAADVFESHPLLPLEQVLSQFTSAVELYDYVEHIDHWQNQVKKHGGRAVLDFRPFLLLVPVGHLCQGDESGEAAEWDTVLAANKVFLQSSFVRVSQTFLKLHMQRMVRVVHPLPYCAAASDSPDEGVLLLHLSEIDSDVITGPTEGVRYIRAEALYGDGVATDIAVETLRPLNQRKSSEGVCDANKEEGVNGGSGGGTGAQLRGFTRHLFQLSGWSRAADPDPNSENKKTSEDGNGNRLGAQPPLYFDAAAARRCLRFVSSEAAKAFAGLGVLDLGVVCPRWLATGSTLLGCSADAAKLAAAASVEGAFAVPSLILPRMRCSDGAVPYGCQEATKEIRIELRAGAFAALCVGSERQKQPFTVYFPQDAAKGVGGDAPLDNTPMLLLRPRRGGGGARLTAPEREGEEQAHLRPRAALLLSCINVRDDELGDGSVLISVELSEEDEARCRGGAEDDFHPGKDTCSGGRGALRWAVTIFDVWELETAPPIAELVERELVRPLQLSLRATDAACHFHNLPVAEQDALLQSLREQFIMAVTPGRNEELEYLGDAILDFVVAQHTLEAWRIGPIVSESSNRKLASHLPETLTRYLRLQWHICNEKRKADVVEALFGAVLMALWVIPQSSVAGGPVTAIGRLPFTGVLQAVRGLMDVLCLVLD
uniref:Dicer 2 n=1 Tax=Trypanosoma conorhini TaxID=83891 RepID=A0A1B2LUM3_9TRYP|nr:dicer 2 [Trypanosoma conorhini]